MQKYIYAYDEDTTASILAKYLIENKLNIAFAESCTAGLLAKTMTDISGSSAYFKMGVITYSNEAKTDMLGVKAETLLNHGAVSIETASEMALGLSKISKSDINVSITGIAGPDGGTPEKPVGTIFISILFKPKDLEDENAEIGVVQRSLQLDWFSRKLNREQVRELAVLKTLYEVYQMLKTLPKSVDL
jgi:nicotinamide-nucleotide amidase